jgi:hypothetical protein
VSFLWNSVFPKDHRALCTFTWLWLLTSLCALGPSTLTSYVFWE